MKSPVGLAILVGLLLIALTRLPQITGGNLAADGDECIVGLMALHLQQGLGVPVFFLGQRYGFSLLEAGAAALSFEVFGFSVTALKVAQLALWSLGVLFLALSVRRAAGGRAVVVATLLLVFCPAWGRWSLKASGGYVTSFVAAHALVWLVTGLAEAARPARARVFGVGVLAALIGWSQPLWLSGSVPFLVRFARIRRDWSSRAVAVAGAAVAGVVLWAAARAGSAYWTPPVLGPGDPGEFVRLLPERLSVFFSGAFYFTQRLDGGIALRVAGVVWAVALVGALLARLRRAPPGPASALAVDATWAVAATMVAAFLVPQQAFFFRYLMPLPGFLVLALAPVLARAGRRLAAAAVVVLTGTGAFALDRLGDLSFFSFPANRITYERGATQRLVDDLLAQGIRRVYCTDPLFQWNIMFVSRERVLARWTRLEDRVPAYPRAVDAALRSGGKVALIGDARDLGKIEAACRRAALQGTRPHPVADLFYVLPDPPEGLLRALGFELDAATPASPSSRW
jgi:hypothetical protein